MLRRLFSRSVCTQFRSSIFQDDLIYYSVRPTTPLKLGWVLHPLQIGELAQRNINQQVTCTQEFSRTTLANFLHQELPVRIAHRIAQLKASSILMRSDNIISLCSDYNNAFHQILMSDKPILDKEVQFANTLRDFYDRDSFTLFIISKGMHEIRDLIKKEKNIELGETAMCTLLDSFLTSRIGVRLLIAQYLELCKPHHDENMIGLISLNTSPYDVAQDAIKDASNICARKLGYSPPVKILGHTDLTFPYIPSHLYYMLLELLKNSMRATVENCGANKHLPPILLKITDQGYNEDVIITISDEGGGIVDSDMHRIWSYLYTTADPTTLTEIFECNKQSMAAVDTPSASAVRSSDKKTAMVRDFSTSSPLAGLGYGLPIARNYARFSGGDLKLESLPGYGTESCIYLPRLSNEEATIM